MHWNQQLQPYSTDHDTDYSMDHKPGESVDLRTDYSMDHKPDTQPDHNSCHSTEHKTVDHSDCAGSTQHPPCHPSQGSSDREQEEVGSGSPQQCRTSVCSRNRSPSCPPVPEHKALCHSETSSHRENRHSTPEHLLTAHVAVHGPGSTAPQTRGGDSEYLTPSLLGVPDPEVESVATPVPDQHPRGHNLDGNKDGGDSVELLLGAPREGVGGGQREAPASPAKPGPSREKHALSSQPENEDFATSELEGEQKQQYICGGFAGMRTSLPSASPHQGQRSPSPSVPAVQWGCSTEQRTMPGKARRWRWTPEHKLQPEYEPEDRGMGAGRGKLFASLRSEESDIPPFADRMRFFEETSRSHSVSHLPGLVCPARRLKVPSLNQRRYSYQGCRDENPQNSHCPPQACRQTASCTVGRKPSDLEQNFSIRAHGQEEPDQGLPVDGDGSGSLCDSNDPCTFQLISQALLKLKLEAPG
ncbi:hypothetical protein JZ751_026969 [Albula glossodonta]|uniref:Uncharacterized protein n=1 Tax=Albula glossodonta TaxID=121402 RepID=A0A8T2NEK1_9TELE|nr:hypothetical protein JZ751_026969 [Albula glossodonta]